MPCCIWLYRCVLGPLIHSPTLGQATSDTCRFGYARLVTFYSFHPPIQQLIADRIQTRVLQTTKHLSPRSREGGVRVGPVVVTAFNWLAVSILITKLRMAMKIGKHGSYPTTTKREMSAVLCSRAPPRPASSELRSGGAVWAGAIKGISFNSCLLCLFLAHIPHWYTLHYGLHDFEGTVFQCSWSIRPHCTCLRYLPFPLKA
jgi:hypothetical protein